MSKDFDAFLDECGIKHQCTVPYRPQKNGVAERKNRSLMEMDRCMVKCQSHAVRCLIYVCIMRIEIQYAVSQASIFMHSPSAKH